jgi:ribosomal protein L7/L12
MKITFIIENETRIEISREFSSLNETQFLEVAQLVWANANQIIEGIAKGRNLVITHVPSHLKIQAIKILREFSGLGLKDAKDFIESGPCSGIPKPFHVSNYRIGPDIPLNTLRENCASELKKTGISCGFYTDDEVMTLEVVGS